MSDFKLLDPENRKQRQAWDEFVETCPDKTMFHTTGWMDVIRKSFGFSPRYGYLIDSGNQIEGLIPLFRVGGLVKTPRWVGLTPGFPCQPLASGIEAATAVVERAVHFARKEGAQALYFRTEQNFPLRLPRGWEVRRESPNVRHTLDLNGCEKEIGSLPGAQPRFRTSFRKYRRKFIAEGGRVRRVALSEAKIFGGLVNKEFYWRRGYLSFPSGYFEALMHSFPKEARLILVESASGKALGYVVVLWSRPRAYLYCSGSFPAGVSANAAIIGIGEEIFHAAEAGLELMDFGETGARMDGVITHTKRWGATSINCSYLVMAKESAASGLVEWGTDMPSRYPVIRWLPSWVSLSLSKPIHKLFQ